MVNIFVLSTDLDNIAIFCHPDFKGVRLLGNTVGVTNGKVVPKKDALSNMHEVIDLVGTYRCILRVSSAYNFGHREALLLALERSNTPRFVPFCAWERQVSISVSFLPKFRLLTSRSPERFRLEYPQDDHLHFSIFFIFLNFSKLLVFP